MKKRLFAALCSLGLLPMGGCGSTLLSMQDAETMLESVLPIRFHLCG